MKILIADSDDLLLDTLVQFLNRFGHSVATATTGIECLHQMEHNRPDVLVLDNELLWGRSPGVLEEMGRDVALCEIPVIMIADCYFSPECEEMPPIVSWLRKPYRLQTLLNEIRGIYVPPPAIKC
jgi:DNA-binding response OmpR family regulator